MAVGAARRAVARNTGSEPVGRHDDGTGEEALLGSPRAATPCCNRYHRAVELVGKRWSGAILLVMMDGPLRFSEIRGAVHDLSDRLLSERLKELEAADIVERRVIDGAPVRVEYALTDKGRALEPTVRALKTWANDWLC